MLGRAKNAFSRLLDARSYIAARLKRQDAEIAELRAIVSALVHDRNTAKGADVSDAPGQGLQAVLFNAAANRAELDRLSALYEPLAMRVAELERELKSRKRDLSK